MYDGEELLNNILSDMRVELTDEFDRNFVRKAFFTEKWAPRKKDGKGSLLVVTGAMRRSIRSSISGHSVVYTSPYPYTDVHNRGGVYNQKVKAHYRTNRKTGKTSRVSAHNRRMAMPKRQFIGDRPEVKNIVKSIVDDNLKDYREHLNDILK